MASSGSVLPVMTQFCDFCVSAVGQTLDQATTSVAFARWVSHDFIMASLLGIRNLHVNFGATKVVTGVDLQLEEGAVLGLVGESIRPCG
jgi:hypothetical protein